MYEVIVDIVERQAIIDLMHRYCHYTDMQDIDGLMTQVFAPESSDDHGGGPVEGTEALTAWFKNTFANVAASAHNLSNIIVDRDGDSATVRSSIVTWSWTKESVAQGPLRQADYVLCCYYVDQVEKHTDGWRIVKRVLETNGQSVLGAGLIPETQTGMHYLATRILERSARTSPYPTEVESFRLPEPSGGSQCPSSG